MPKVVLPVPEVSENVIRPVVFDIARQLMKKMKISPDTKILYPGDSDKAKQPGSELTQTSGVNTLPFHDRLFIEVDEEFDSEKILNTAVFQAENLFIFRDDRIDTYIKPIYGALDLNLNFKYRAEDKTSALKWRNDLRNRVGMLGDNLITMHDITYSYLIPSEFLIIIKELHRLRENVAGYGENFDQYFKSNLTSNASLVSNMNGESTAWGISEKQLRIIGQFDFDGIPEKGSKEDEGDTWSIGFTYKVKFEMPAGCIIAYSIVVHNQLISQKFRPNREDRIPSIYRNNFSYTLSSGAFSKFDVSNRNFNATPGISIPEFDEFIPSDIATSTLRLFTALVNIDEKNPKFLMSLKDISKNYNFNSGMMDFLVQEAPYMHKFGFSIICLQLYRNQYLVKEYLTVDDLLNVNLIEEVSLRNNYHVRFSFITDLRLLTKEAIDRLRHSPGPFKLILDYLDKSGLCSGLLKPLKDRYITRNNMDEIIDNLNDDTISYGNRQIYSFSTVETLIVTASKDI